MRFTRENTVGLVIDIQEKLLPAMAGQEDLLTHCKILIEGFQELGIPLIVTQQYSKGLGETVEPVKLVIKDFNPIEKREFSCCDAVQVQTNWKKKELSRESNKRTSYHLSRCIQLK